MKKVTLDSIAQELGTTKITVSRALRGKPGVGDTLREKIISLAKEYNYTIKRRQPKRQTPAQVTLICTENRINDTGFWDEIMSGVFDYTARHNIGIRTVMVDEFKDDVKSLLPLQEEYCDGILVVGDIPESLIVRVTGLGLPLVTAAFCNFNVECDSVTIANQHGVRKALHYLAQCGHTKIGFINHISHTYNDDQRYIGMRIGMEELGLTLDPRFVWLDATYQAQYYRDHLDSLAAYKDAPSAWMCVHDLVGYNLCSVLAERGIRVPDDVSIVGFGNDSRPLHTPLTTMDIQKKTIGYTAMERLIYRIQHPDEQPYILIEVFTRLIDKGSVRIL